MRRGQSAGVRQGKASSSTHVRSPSGRRQKHVCLQSSSKPQKPIAHADEKPSQSKSPWQGTGTRLVVVVLAKVHDVLVVVIVDVVDVVDATIAPCVVVVWRGRCPPPPPPPAIVVVLVVAGAMHRTERGVGRQRSTSFTGAAPGVSAMRSGRALRTGTVNVCV